MPTLRWTPFVLMLVVVTATGCGGDDDCYTERRCETVNGELTCVWVKVCPGDEGYDGSLALTHGRLPAADRAVDVRLDAASPDAARAFLARLLGESMAPYVERGSDTELWLRGWTARQLEAASAGIPALRLASAWPPDNEVEVAACGGAGLPPRDPALQIPSFLHDGDPIYLRAPTAVELAGDTRRTRLLAEVTPPDALRASFHDVREGDTIRVLLDRTGTWRLRVLLLADGLCEPDQTHAILLEDRSVEVLPVLREELLE